MGGRSSSFAEKQSLAGRRRESASGLTIPKTITDVSLKNVKEAINAAGLEMVQSSKLTDSDIGKEFIISDVILERSFASRRDPDGVEFKRAIYRGVTKGAFGRPIFELEGGRRKIIEDDMPYETIYRKKGRR